MKTLSELESEARDVLKMVGFDDEGTGKICCPWLHWYAKKMGEKNLLDGRWEGILIMQDWGTVDQSGKPEKLEAAIDYIAKAKNANEPTIKNLYASEWRCVIWGDNPTWLVTNAVWGLRNKPNREDKIDKCGYLGDSIHAKAFPIWASVLAQASTINPELRVVFAGSWARFDKESENSKKLKVFLTNWRNWRKRSVQQNESSEKSDLDLEFVEKIEESATAHFYSHPSIWQKQNCWDGPPSCQQ
jgi:hypothetical protein